MPNISNATVAILATDGFEQAELTVPLEKLRAAGATVVVVAPEGSSIKGWDETDWGDSVPVDMTLDRAKVGDFDALVLPGGQINPDKLRTNEAAVAFIRDFYNSGKTLAAICHAPWLLIEAGVIAGRNVTSFASIRTDVVNAGATWHDKEVVTDKGLITSRKPGDLDAFVAKIIEEVQEGTHARQAA